MVLHPHVWKRAQAEIDVVIGTDRLPNFSDRPALPYVDAIVRETVRWSPVIPLGKTIIQTCIHFDNLVVQVGTPHRRVMFTMAIISQRASFPFSKVDR